MTARSLLVPILAYHSISRDSVPGFREFVLSPDLFSRHLDFISREGYTTITVSSLASAMLMPRRELPEKPLLLTFDDGFVDFYTQAFPVMKQYRMTGTLFVPTAYVGKTSGWLVKETATDRYMLDWEQLREISASGIECGAHSHTHPMLDALSARQAYEEIVHSKLILEENLGGVASSFAYPYGFYSTETRRLVRRAGFAAACAIRYRLSSTTDDLFTLSRLVVFSHTDVNQLNKLLTKADRSAALVMRRLRSWAWRTLRQSVYAISQRASQGGV